MVASVVLVFALWVAYELSTGRLDPLGSAYYGVVVSWRMDVLLALLVALEALCLVDAVTLGWRCRRWGFWTVLGIAVLALPLCLTICMAQVDVWRQDQRATSANVIAGGVMVMLIAGAAALRRWAWRFTGAQEA